MVTLLLTSFLGSLGFSLVFHVKKKGILPFALGGLITCAIHLIFFEGLGTNLFLSSLAAGAVAQLYAQVLARLTHTPATVYYITSLIPLIPGGSLYRTMDALVSTQWDALRLYGVQTLLVTLGLALGVGLVSGILHFFEKK